mmetsp:Transcript_18963/g.35391  ORF Transcript_18963/g.35391 Transcript_18963/m.35391 type:complete len:209 (-) Transcript_18963:189-815(-)
MGSLSFASGWSKNHFGHRQHPTRIVTSMHWTTQRHFHNQWSYGKVQIVFQDRPCALKVSTYFPKTCTSTSPPQRTSVEPSVDGIQHDKTRLFPLDDGSHSRYPRSTSTTSREGTSCLQYCLSLETERQYLPFQRRRREWESCNSIPNRYGKPIGRSCLEPPNTTILWHPSSPPPRRRTNEETETKRQTTRDPLRDGVGRSLLPKHKTE